MLGLQLGRPPLIDLQADLSLLLCLDELLQGLRLDEQRLFLEDLPDGHGYCSVGCTHRLPGELGTKGVPLHEDDRRPPALQERGRVVMDMPQPLGALARRVDGEGVLHVALFIDGHDGTRGQSGVDPYEVHEPSLSPEACALCFLHSSWLDARQAIHIASPVRQQQGSGVQWPPDRHRTQNSRLCTNSGVFSLTAPSSSPSSCRHAPLPCADDRSSPDRP